jgi:uroporphyrinogen decarboxylase
MPTVERRYGGEPDFEHFRQTVMRETEKGPVPLIEAVVDPEVEQAIMGRSFPVPRHILAGDMPSPEDLGNIVKLADLIVDFFYAMGYDFVPIPPVVPLLQTPQIKHEDTAPLGTIRGWQKEHGGLIANREEFEKYPWPPAEGNPIQMMPIQYAAKKMPEGMKILAFLIGPMEYLRAIMSYEKLCYALIDQPDLVEAVASRIGEVIVNVSLQCLESDDVGAFYMGDDLAFTNGPMISPAHLNKHILPVHKTIAKRAREMGKPFILHSCGDNRLLIPDFIDEIGIDALHSFQDNVYPPEEIKESHGDRISIMGGIDVDVLARGPEEKIRKRTREILEFCTQGGGFCLGSGNSVPDYVPPENYLAMLDEWQRWNHEHWR